MPTRVIHACWSAAALRLWAEVEPANDQLPEVVATATGEPPAHPFAQPGSELASSLPGLADLLLPDGPVELTIALPAIEGQPVPSPTLAHAIGHAAALDGSILPRLARFRVHSVGVPPIHVPAALEAIENLAAAAADAAPPGEHPAITLGAGTEFFAVAARFVRWLMLQQRLVPTLVQDLQGHLHGLWQPWLADDSVAVRAKRLLDGMPPAARAAVDGFDHDAWPILEDFLVRTTDAQCRAVMRRENMVETIESRRGQPDAHVQWLDGLLTREGDDVPAAPAHRSEILRRVRVWISGLDERTSGSAWRLCLRLSEPVDLAEVVEFAAPDTGLRWTLSLHLQSVEDPNLFIDAKDIWLLAAERASVGGRHVEKPAEVLLKELARAARLYKPLEVALRDSEPAELELTTTQAYEFLREVRPVLLEQGFGVQSPDWWDSPASRLGVRLRIDSGQSPPELAAASQSATGPRLGLEALVNYRWQVTIGDTVLSLQEFERLAALRSPLVLVGGRWVEIRPEDVRSAVDFMRQNPGGEMELGKAMRLAYAADLRETGIPVLGLEATGWIANILGGQDGNTTMPLLEPPPGFVGSLRPYQVKGLSWLAFLDRLGLGSCLADDMGLGKTIQLLAMMLHERPMTDADGTVHAKPLPTLLIVPMSVVGNWQREAHRFAPSLQLYVHHGLDRKRGDELVASAQACDLVITTYSLAHRDREDLERVNWGRVALDEAQNIKNPGTKQAQAVRAIDAPRRIALTGTPIENRLSELWSIMDFLNPGLLGSAHDFRKRFSVPIERYHDQHRGKQLRGMIQPFVLRRLKTDPTVIADLPEKVETKEFCYLTPEQANLYEAAVREMLSTAEHSEGIQRRGVILAGLVKLKQICNHPAQFLKHTDPQLQAAMLEGDVDESAGGAPAQAPIAAPHRSGKCARIIEMLDEVIASGGQALVFTQFRQMGTMLAAMLRHELDREVLFLHGGTPAKERDRLVNLFNKADGSAPVFILSLKAGGVGLNLTGANHVFHFDRWWNPAVEAQATDRAYRIGQTRTVQVHKFVVSGTLEERIDQMIEQKSGLADSIIGSGEHWLTELSLTQLREVLTLKPEAVEIES
jgi:SNF2 family DNA or RNA helicase